MNLRLARVKGLPRSSRKLAENRLIIEAVSPEIECGRYPAKAAVGDCSRWRPISSPTATKDRRRAADPPRRRGGLARGADGLLRQRPLARLRRAGRRTPAIATRSSPGAISSPAGATRSRRSTRPACRSSLELIEGRNLVEGDAAGGERTPRRGPGGAGGSRKRAGRRGRRRGTLLAAHVAGDTAS